MDKSLVARFYGPRCIVAIIISFIYFLSSDSLKVQTFYKTHQSPFTRAAIFFWYFCTVMCFYYLSKFLPGCSDRTTAVLCLYLYLLWRNKCDDDDHTMHLTLILMHEFSS